MHVRPISWPTPGPSLSVSRFLTVLISTILLLALLACSASASQALLHLSSQSISETDVIVDALKLEGIAVGHVLSPGYIIADLPTSLDGKALSTPGVLELHRDSVPADGVTNRNDALAISAWNALRAPETLSVAPPGRPLSGDVVGRYRFSGSSTGTLSVNAPNTSQTSYYMVGKVAVGIILPESDGSGENWSSARETTVYNQIVKGLNWWVAKRGTTAPVTFYYDTHFDVPTQYEPITMDGPSDEDKWVSDILGNMGYTSGSNWTRASNYVNDIRRQYKTDWCFAVIVVDSLNDSDGLFKSGYFAYAWFGGPYLIMTYDNDGWGISRMNSVLSHETGHIFYAGDEYCQQGYSCCDTSASGYLDVANLNCELNNPSSVACIMRSNENSICQYTIGQIGWRDTDGDGLPDVVDNTVNNLTNRVTSPTKNWTLTFTGNANDVPCVSPTMSDVTINTIAAVKFRIDGGQWMDAAATDGQFDEDSEAYTFTTPGLSFGLHTIETQATSSSGNKSVLWSQIVDEQSGSTVYVDKQNTGTVHDGSTWATAFTTVQAGIDATTAGRQVWVADGLYSERITLKPEVPVYGGFEGSETKLNERNVRRNVATIDAGGAGTAVVAPTTCTTATAIDGFTITNGSAPNGGGIYCAGSPPRIANNIIVGNTAVSYGGGIYAPSGTPSIVNNVITSNTAESGAGIYTGEAVTVINNTIVSNSATGEGSAVYLSSSTGKVCNNIIAFNMSGVFASGGSPTLGSNCVYQNTAYNYSGAASSGDITDDPAFVDAAVGDYRLTFLSPCVDGGSNAEAPSVDRDNSMRPQDGNGDGSAGCDIGAYEMPVPLNLAKMLYPDNSLVSVGGLAATAVFPALGQMYAELQDRTTGIRIDTSAMPSVNQIVNVVGSMQTDALSGERYVVANAGFPALAANGAPVSAIGMSNTSLGGSAVGYQDGVWYSASSTNALGELTWTWLPADGVNNIGLLVRTTGSVTYIDPAGQFFYLSDGSDISDGTNLANGVRVNFDGRSYTVGQTLSVTGISSCFKPATKACRLLKVRSASDIQAQ